MKSLNERTLNKRMKLTSKVSPDLHTQIYHHLFGQLIRSSRRHRVTSR